MIGLSLSFCISDILQGRQREADVDLIVAGTRIQEDSPEHFEHVLDSYAGNYWYVAPEEGKAIARRLWEAGKIFQARNHGGEAPNIADGHWIEITKQLQLL